MESQIANRRLKMISAHFATNDDISATVFPMNCSGGLNSVIRRFDNRIYFARQGSRSQACFMRQASTEQGCSDQLGVPLQYPHSRNEGFSDIRLPCFSRPASMNSNVPNIASFQPMVQDCKLPISPPPTFSRPKRELKETMQFSSMKKVHDAENPGFELSPRMDVAESGSNYVITLELPSVSVNDIRVEVDNKILAVRSTQRWKVGFCSSDTISECNKREIQQRPYEVVWPLPVNVNPDSVSAEFLNGFLRITIPKL